MKAIKYVLMISAAALLVACNDTKELAEITSLPEQEVILTATRENLDAGTRSFRLDDGSVWWNPNEEVSVFYGSGSGGGSKFVSMNTSIAETVELQGTIQMSGSGKEFWAVYPYSEDNSCDGSSITTVIPARQIGVEGNFSGDVFPAMAKGSSTSLPFWNICGGVKFFVSRSDIKSVTFKGNNGEVLAGKVKVSFNANGVPEVIEVVSGVNRVTLTAPDGGTFTPGKYYYITLLPTSLEQGFTFTFETDSQVGTLKSDKTNTVKRSTFGVLKNVDTKVSDWNDKFVDLGLSVKWAAWNLGASAPEEYGDYYAWGETEPKENYNWSTYKWCNGDYDKLTKYCTKSFYWDSSDPMDNNSVLDQEDDAAQTNWGGSWRMPTDAEWTELINNCTWTWTAQNGVNGRLVTGPNGNSIFLPAAGCRIDADPYSVGSYGGYWSSSLYTVFPYFAWCVYFDSDDVDWANFSHRYYGFSVRPVYGEFIQVSSITLDKNSLELIIGDTAQLNATISPSNATVPKVRWVSGDKTIVTVDRSENLSALAVGSTTISAYSSNGLSASCVVTVEPPEAIDLGLPSGLKWASLNVGATKPEEYGKYFAWGETAPNDYYGWSTYKWCNGDYNTLTKYCTNSSYWDSSSPMDNKTILDPEDDAASANWGGSWRMPTDGEWTELRENCTWTWTSDYNGTGIAGRVVTASNGNSIFLPAAGYRDDKLLYDVGSDDNYWSSSLDTGYPNKAWAVYFPSDNVDYDLDRFSCDRYFGFSVRPVYGDRIHPESVSLDKTSLSMYVSSSTLLTPTVLPNNALEKNVVWSSDNIVVANVNRGGFVTALKEGSATITATTIDGGKMAECVVTVKQMPIAEAIDLGLPSGLKWAAFNVGASVPEECGGYFAWGETQPKVNYDWSTYKFRVSGDSWEDVKFNKYCPSSQTSSWGLSGSPDNKLELDPEDDAASANWGGSWRMPTEAEWRELTHNCTWTWTDNYNETGIAGSVYTSTNGNSIFLPAAGYRYESFLTIGNRGYYWSSSLGAGDPGSVWEILFCDYGVSTGNVAFRCEGRPVRPVTE